jgi:hypothetical protein
MSASSCEKVACLASNGCESNGLASYLRRKLAAGSSVVYVKEAYLNRQKVTEAFCRSSDLQCND